MESPVLKQQVGKKLLWVGYDSRNELTYLVFEGQQVVAVEQANAVGVAAVKKYVEENIELADAVKALQAILKETQNVAPTPVAATETGSAPAQSGAGGDAASAPQGG